MLSPYQTYRERVHFKGKTKREYVKTKVNESIESLINDSQYGFTIKVDGIEHDVAILSTRTTQEYESANIIAPLNVGLDRGTIFDWNNSDDDLKEDEHWIILKKMFRPDQPGFNGIAYRCTGDLKWIDEEGQLQVQHAYIRAGRITNALGVTPDVNRKFDNLFLHDSDWNMMAATPMNLNLKREMRFIIKGQAYRVSNIDNVSIDNVSILSFEDDRILDTDDVKNSIAYNDIYDYSLKVMVTEPISLYGGDVKDVPVVVMNKGVECDETFSLVSSDPSIVEVKDGRIIGRGIGSATITCILNKNETIRKDIAVEVIEDHVEQKEEIYISGSDTINWNSSETYVLSNGEAGTFEVEVRSKIRKTITWGEDGKSVTIAIKDKYSGTIDITAFDGEGNEYHKIVYIKTV